MARRILLSLFEENDGFLRERLRLSPPELGNDSDEMLRHIDRMEEIGLVRRTNEIHANPPPDEQYRLGDSIMKTTVSSKGQIVIPAEIRRQDAIEPGQEIEIERIGRGEYRLRRYSGMRTEGLLEWLLACPEKGYFVPLESESTDSL